MKLELWAQLFMQKTKISPNVIPFAVCFALLTGCLDFVKVISSNEKQFLAENLQSGHTTKGSEFDVFYVVKRSKNIENPIIVFIHGSPGEWNAFAHVMNDSALSSSFTMISYDRPGFGQTRPKKAEPSLKSQAMVVRDILLRENVVSPVIVVGHSYGGPVALQFANDFPGMTHSLVLLASPADPELEKPFWYNKLANASIIRWMLPKTMRYSNDEILTLGSELTQLSKVWNNDSLSISLVHGRKDKLVPFEHTHFVERHISSERLKTYYDDQADHFFIWSDIELMRKLFLDILPPHK